MAEKRITQENWDKVEAFVTEQHESRKTSDNRRDHERIWKEVDRQIRMKPKARVDTSGKEIDVSKDWHNALELGELSTASEVIASDVMRIIFQSTWFEPHAEMKWPIDPETGRPKIDDDKQDIADGLLRNLMVQQHKDFGLKARFRLSVKESLHHGGFCAEVRMEEQLLVREGSKIRKVAAPVWVPYSMWNSFPDPSPAVIGTNMFYTGNMILVEYLPYAKLKDYAKGDGWMSKRLAQVEKSKKGDGKDVELVKFKGDIYIDRSTDDIYLPNSEVILANGKLVYYAPAELDYPNVIYSGYERQDVRDPYYTSPIIKLSPTQQIASIVANKFLDGTALHMEPPIEYDSNDPDYAASGGPVIAPGAKTGTRSVGSGMKALMVGDPNMALGAYTLTTQQMKEGLGVSANRSGVRQSDRETATAANLANQGAEVRTMEFVSQLEPQALMPYLYMQHDWNRRKMKEYDFYNDEMHTPDFMRATRKDIDANCHFEITGSRGLLGEEKRRTSLKSSVAFFSGNPLFATRLDVDKIMLDTFRDDGKKNPEEWLKATEKGLPPQVQQQMQQMGQMIQQLQGELQKAQSGEQAKMAKLQLDKAIADMKNMGEMQKLELEKMALMAQTQTDNQDRVAENKRAQDELRLKYEQMQQDYDIAMKQIQSDLVQGERDRAAQREQAEARNTEMLAKAIEKMSAPRKIVRGADGKADRVESA